MNFSDTNPSRNMKMDPGIWGGLPEHLLDRIILFLPLKTYLKLRSTCKRFNSLIFSPCFISKHALSSSSPLASFILLAHPQFQQKYHLFNTEINSWCNTPLSLPSSNLLSSSNGLLCFHKPTSSCFIIYNLFARSFTRIKFPTRPFDFELLTLISVSSGYKLFMLSSIRSSSHKALVYDSKTGSWNQFTGFDRTLNESYHQKGTFYNGGLIFTTSEPFNVVCFDLENGKWERSMTVLPSNLTFARLLSDEENKLYLIGGVGVSGISRSIKVWELRGDDWVEVETMPDMLFRKFRSVCYHNYEHVYCFWHQGMICVCCSTWPEILYFKMSRRTWYWLPKCPSLPDKCSCGFSWFSFRPGIYIDT